MPMIPFRPDDGSLDAGYPTVVPADHGAGIADIWAWATAHTTEISYGVAGTLAVLLLLAIRARRKRAVAETGDKAAITPADRAITRLTGIMATAVLAVGMWGFFEDVLHLHPLVRISLFAFGEAQIISAWRRGLRTLHRHGHLGTAVRTIYLIAFGSATIAAWHASTLQEAGFRLYVAFVAAYMVAEELAEERDIFLKANPHMITAKVRKAARRINWSLTPERVLVWLRLAEPSEREVEDVERQRRIARFARTAHRLHTLTETDGAKWRIRLATRSLRHQAEAANEHLSLASDWQSMNEVRHQLAFLYQVVDGTSRSAVADLSPFRPAPKLAISDKPHVPPLSDPLGVRDGEPVGDENIANESATEGAGRDANDEAMGLATDPAIADASTPAAKAAIPATRKPAMKRAANPATEGVHPTALKLAKYLAKYPADTNVELAKRMRVGDRTVSRYRADAEALIAAQKTPSLVPFTTPIPEPKPTVSHGVNGNYFPTTEEN